jgi:hypothetical protein
VTSPERFETYELRRLAQLPGCPPDVQAALRWAADELTRRQVQLDGMVAALEDLGATADSLADEVTRLKGDGG